MLISQKWKSPRRARCETSGALWHMGRRFELPVSD